MNPMEGALRRVDGFQQRHGAFGLVFGVLKKFGDDNAGVLVSNLAYSAFGAIFPLLLLLVTILGLVLRGEPSVRASVLHSALAEFPVIGNQLGQNIHALQRGSVLALAVALLALVWTSTGLAQAGLFTMAQIWNVPGPKRPNYPRRLLRSVGFLAVIALGLIVTTALASFGSFSGHTLGAAIGAELVAVAINIAQPEPGVWHLRPRARPAGLGLHGSAADRVLGRAEHGRGPQALATGHRPATLDRGGPALPCPPGGAEPAAP
jgi:uncharacterized BrkB/YihY/UPF0761 family membrane protein